MATSLETYLAQVQAIAGRLKTGNCNKAFAAAELDRINLNFSQGNVDAAKTIEDTLTDIVSSNDDLDTAITKVDTVSTQLKTDVDPKIIAEQAAQEAQDLQIKP
jgi:hypothetical protein